MPEARMHGIRTQLGRIVRRGRHEKTPASPCVSRKYIDSSVSVSWRPGFWRPGFWRARESSGAILEEPSGSGPRGSGWERACNPRGDVWMAHGARSGTPEIQRGRSSSWKSGPISGSCVARWRHVGLLGSDQYQDVTSIFSSSQRSRSNSAFPRRSLSSYGAILAPIYRIRTSSARKVDGHRKTFLKLLDSAGRDDASSHEESFSGPRARMARARMVRGPSSSPREDRDPPGTEPRVRPGPRSPARSTLWISPAPRRIG